jgi:hypothetical protein
MRELIAKKAKKIQLSGLKQFKDTVPPISG